MSRRSERIELPITAPGVRQHILVHKFGPAETTGPKAYIQASLHADEIPGLLVNHHLLQLLEEADSKGLINNEIIIVPYANPIGLSQWMLGSPIGRFNLDSGINFNRDWPNVTGSVAAKVESKLSKDDSAFNTVLIRQAILEAVDEDRSIKVESVMKKSLFKIASVCDIAIDLHCDTDAVMHMYTHDRLWPAMVDLACELKSECQLTAPSSGGTPFDEACSCLWADLADKFPDCPIPMACQSTTIELRGEVDVGILVSDAK